ncbi:MAG: hypothetical protein ACI90V_002046, partial [Bacillariaceae sp.]
DDDAAALFFRKAPTANEKEDEGLKTTSADDDAAALFFR